MKTILNERTEQKLAPVRADLPHALFLTGEKGVGLKTIASELAGKDAATSIEPVDSKGNVNFDTGTITVEVIRTLYEQTRAKKTSRQIVIIDGAERMSLSAQAAFLKLLEEPSENTHFILAAHSLQGILPTVRSRVQVVFVEPISEKQTRDFLQMLHVTDSQKQVQLEYLASGLPAELQRLVSDDSYFNRRAEIMGDTRSFLTGSLYGKLLIVHKYHQDRAKALELIQSALMVSNRTLHSKPTPELIAQLEKLLRVKEKIEGNCNIRLQLASFTLS